MRTAAASAFAHATSAGSVKICVNHRVDIIYHAVFADVEALDMIESVKDSVFVAPAVGFPMPACTKTTSTGCI